MAFSQRGQLMTVEQIAAIADDLASRQFPLFNGGAARSHKERCLDAVNVKEYGAKGDNTHDDTQAFMAALAVCETSHLPMKIPAGTYRLTTWTTRISTWIVLVGDGLGVTTIRGPKVVGTHFAKMTSGGVFDVEGVCFQNFDNVGYSEESVDTVRIVECKALHNRSYFYRQADVTDYPLSSTGRAILNNNEVELCAGFMMSGRLPNGGVAFGNVMKDVKRDTTVWTSDLPLWQTVGISFGDTDNNASIISQAYVGKVNVFGNIIDGMYNTSTSAEFNTTKAIQVTGISAVITGNMIRGLDAVDTVAIEAIYCKAKNYTISDNVVIDGTRGNTCIAVKGTLDDDGPMQKDGLISGNVVIAKDQVNSSGISVFNGGRFDILNNIISGMGGSSIQIYGDPYDSRIEGNHIYDNGGISAIALLVGSLSNVRIRDNQIDGMLATSGDMRPIRVSANPRQLSTIHVDNGGAGYPNSGSLTISGGGGTATGQYTAVDGVIISAICNESNALFTSVPTIIANGSGSGAVLTGVLSTGKINDLSIKGNAIKWSPKSTLSSACAIYVQSDSSETASCGGIVINDNSARADSFATAADIRGVNLYSAAAGWLRDAEINGLRLWGPDPAAIKAVSVNGNASLYTQGANYDSLDIKNVMVNGARRRVLSKAQVDETRATFVIALTGAAVGAKLLGYIPNSVLVTKAMIFVNGAPTSATSAANIAFSLGYAGTKGILANTLVTAFTANTFKSGTPDGQPANAIRASASAGKVPVYLDVATEALTGGVLTLILETEAFVQ